MIIQDNSWENFVPNAVSKIIHEINGVQRLKLFQNQTQNLSINMKGIRVCLFS